MRLEKIFRTSLGIKQNETVLIITDKKRLNIAKRFFNSLKKVSGGVSILVKPLGKYHGEEPPKNISRAMLRSDVVIAVTTHSLTHTNSRRNASRKGVRIVSMPGFTEKMIPTLKADPTEMLHRGKQIEKSLKKTKAVRVKTEQGTDISFLVSGRKIEIDSGLFYESGDYGNLPSGEISVSPKEGTANGIVVIDSMEDYVKPKTVVYIENGKAAGINDKRSDLAKIFKTVKNSTNVAEFGIGLNPKAKIIGNLLQDEKALGTCHIAFGNNKSYGGKIYSKVHLDAIIFEPTIWFDNNKVMSKGIIKV